MQIYFALAKRISNACAKTLLINWQSFTIFAKFAKNKVKLHLPLGSKLFKSKKIHFKITQHLLSYQSEPKIIFSSHHFVEIFSSLRTIFEAIFSSIRFPFSFIIFAFYLRLLNWYFVGSDTERKGWKMKKISFPSRFFFNKLGSQQHSLISLSLPFLRSFWTLILSFWCLMRLDCILLLLMLSIAAKKIFLEFSFHFFFLFQTPEVNCFNYQNRDFW
jgi:hypothetical protein